MLAKRKFNQGNKDLLRLAKFLDTVPKSVFDFATWVNVSAWDGKPGLSCGTTACALGWATTIPQFRRRGLKMYVEHYGDDSIGFAEPVCHDNEGVALGVAAASRFFGLEHEQSGALFLPESEANRKVPGTSVLQMDATPKMVANNIRGFVKNRKYNPEQF